MKKSKKNLGVETQRTSSKKCPYHGVECDGLGRKCESCMRSQMDKESYDEFISGIQVPPGV